MKMMNRLNNERMNDSLNWAAWLHLWLVQHVIVSNEFGWSLSGTVHCPFDVEQPRRSNRLVLFTRLCITYWKKPKEDDVS